MHIPLGAGPFRVCTISRLHGIVTMNRFFQMLANIFQVYPKPTRHAHVFVPDTGIQL